MLLYKHFKGAPSQLATRETWPPCPALQTNTYSSRGRPGEGRCQHGDWGGRMQKPSHFLPRRPRPLWTSCVPLLPSCELLPKQGNPEAFRAFYRIRSIFLIITETFSITLKRWLIFLSFLLNTEIGLEG